jgi:hypothetical protein
VNNFGRYGHCAFAKFTDVWTIQDDFARKVEAAFERMIGRAYRVGSVEAPQTGPFHQPHVRPARRGNCFAPPRTMSSCDVVTVRLQYRCLNLCWRMP